MTSAARRLLGVARFDDVRGTFWGISGHWVQPALTDESICEAERLLGVTLPPSLLDLLRLQNGGVVANDWVVFPTTQAPGWSRDHVPFDVLMGIGPSNSLLDTPYLVEEWGLPSPLVLLAGDGHCWIGLDYRACGPHGEPSVGWFDVELGAEAVLASDFHSFVKQLTSADRLVGGSSRPS